MSLKLAAGVSMVCASSAPAAAERAIMVELAQPAPFQPGQLADAMRMRLPADGAPVRIRVSPTADGVHVDTDPGSRDVALHGLAGADAARLVALAASDLLLDDLAAAPELAVHAPAGADARARLALGVSGAAAAWDGALATGSLELIIPRGRFAGAIEIGGGAVAGGPLDLVAGVARLDAGARLGPAGILELRAGATLAPIVVRTGAGDATVLAGANASARLRIGVTSAVRAVIAAGADLFATRTQYMLDGATVLTTPRIAPWLAAGLEVAL